MTRCRLYTWFTVTYGIRLRSQFTAKPWQGVRAATSIRERWCPSTLGPNRQTPHGGAGAGVQARDRNPSTVPRAAAGASSRRLRRPGAASVGAARCGDQPPAVRLPRIGLPPPSLPLRLPHHLSNQCVASSLLDSLALF